MMDRYVVLNRTKTAWFSHVDQVNNRVEWTRKSAFATKVNLRTAKSLAKKYGGSFEPVPRSDEPEGLVA